MTAFPLRPDQHRRGQAPAGAPTNNLEGKQRPLAVVFTLCSLLVVSATGQSADTLFSRANDLYRAGAFAQAAQQYEAILSQGSVSGEVQFNLGNCYYREGGVGRAILAFERAQRLMPSDDDVAHNLHLARLKTVDRIEPVPEFFLVAWLRAASEIVPPAWSRTLFLSFWSLVFASLAALYLGRSAAIIRWSRIAFFGTIPPALVFGIMFVAQVMVLREENAGIIVTPTVTAKSSPDATGVDAFVIHEGLKVEMATTVDGWTRVTLADGKVAWVRAADVERI